MRPAVKWTVIGLSSLLIVSLLSFWLLIWILPSPKTIGSLLNGMRQSPVEFSHSPTLRSDSETEQKESSKLDPQDIESQKSPTSSRRQTDAMSSYILERFFSENESKIDACSHLLEATRVQVIDKKSLDEVLESVANREKPGDPNMEAVFVPVQYALNRPPLRKLLRQVEEAQNSDDDSFFTKLDFYSQMTVVSSDLMARQPDIEKSSMHGYHLYVLSRAIYEKPNLLDDPKTMELCQNFQAHANDSQVPDFAEDREKLTALLREAGLSNEQVGFDPEMPSTITFQSERGRFMINIPWIKRLAEAETADGSDLQ